MKRQIAIAIVTFILGSVAANAATVLSDGNFGLPWTSTQIDGAGSQNIETQVSGGNPDSYFRIQTTSGLGVVNNHLNSSLVYAPSSGAITSIDFAIEYRNFAVFGQGMGLRFIAQQDGTVFQTGNFITNEDGLNNIADWRTFLATSLTASDFLSLGAASILDFSASGGVIKFGFQTFNESGGGITVGYDNFSATINTAPVPIPATLPLLAVSILGVGGFASLQRKKRRGA